MFVIECDFIHHYILVSLFFNKFYELRFVLCVYFHLPVKFLDILLIFKRDKKIP